MELNEAGAERLRTPSSSDSGLDAEVGTGSFRHYRVSQSLSFGIKGDALREPCCAPRLQLVLVSCSIQHYVGNAADPPNEALGFCASRYPSADCVTRAFLP